MLYSLSRHLEISFRDWGFASFASNSVTVT